MSVRSAQSITVLFTTRAFATGVGVNADSLPTGTLYVNGVANGATVTITNLDTGRYTADSSDWRRGNDFYCCYGRSNNGQGRHLG